MGFAEIWRVWDPRGSELFPPRSKPTLDLRARAWNARISPPSTRAPRVPVALDEICLSALAADKQDRYAGCNEMALALQTWLTRNAPTIGDTQMAAFMRELFAEDILYEREELDKLSWWAEALLGRS